MLPAGVNCTNVIHDGKPSLHRLLNGSSVCCFSLRSVGRACWQYRPRTKHLPSRPMASIHLRTEVPGPNSRALLQRRSASVAACVARSTDIVIDRADGALVHDVDGNVLIDMAGGIGMLAAGHCPAPVVSAIHQQADRLLHPCFLVATYEPYVQLCEMMSEITPGDFPKKTILGNSGAEAVENAVKLARSYTGRSAIVVFEGAYHGRTLLTLSMTSKYGLFKKGFGPFAPEIYRLPAPNPYRRPSGMSSENYVE